MTRQAIIASLFLLVLAGCSDAAPQGHEAAVVVDASLCVEGWEQCNGNEVRQCTRGEWSPWGACPYACISGAAGSGCTGVCVPGTQRFNCIGIQTCSDEGLWQPMGGSCEGLVDAQASE